MNFRNNNKKNKHVKMYCPNVQIQNVKNVEHTISETDLKNVCIFDRGQLVLILLTFNTVSHMKITLHNLYSKLL